MKLLVLLLASIFSLWIMAFAANWLLRCCPVIKTILLIVLWFVAVGNVFPVDMYQSKLGLFFIGLDLLLFVRFLTAWLIYSVVLITFFWYLLLSYGYIQM